jgi:hypothetical protein
MWFEEHVERAMTGSRPSKSLKVRTIPESVAVVKISALRFFFLDVEVGSLQR